MISVVVPIYNVELYLRKCIDSIVNQTYKDLEIILVDDGSPDNCGLICDEYAKMDNRIKVIHKENGGLSTARNAGLDIATGSYIGFVDSDDWIEPTMYEKMYSFLVENNLDLVECGINLISSSSVTSFITSQNIIVSGRNSLKMHLDTNGRTNQSQPRTAVWSKLFKSSFWADKRFPVGEIHEDYLLTCYALYEAKRVGILREGLLNHLVDNPTSIVNSKFSKRDLFKGTQLQNRISYLHFNNDDELEIMAKCEYYSYLISIVWLCDVNKISERDDIIYKIKDNLHLILQLNLSMHRKIEAILISYCPSLYLYLRKFYNKLR